MKRVTFVGGPMNGKVVELYDECERVIFPDFEHTVAVYDFDGYVQYLSCKLTYTIHGNDAVLDEKTGTNAV